MKAILYNIRLLLTFCTIFGVSLLVYKSAFSQAQEYIMTDGGSIVTCEGTFYDPGGTGVYPAPAKGIILGVGGESVYTYTICNKLSGKPIKVTFDGSFKLWSNSTKWNCWQTSKDKLEIYNGSSTSAPKIGTYEKTQSPGMVVGTDGCLTFKLILDQIGNNSPCDESFGEHGWVATISSDPPTAGPIEGPDTIISGQQATYTQTGDDGGTWSFTGDQNSAFMNSSGTVTGLSAGTINVTYKITDCGGDMAVKQVKIVDPPLPECVISGESVVCKDSTIQLASTSNGGTWISEHTTIASVSSSGVVTGLSQGTATISYVVNSVCEITKHDVIVEICPEKEDTIPIVPNPVGIQEIEQLTNVSLFPNPTNSELNIVFELNSSAETAILLTDLSGRIIEQKMLNASSGINNISLDMQQYSAGVYSVVLQSNGSQIVKRLVRN